MPPSVGRTPKPGDADYVDYLLSQAKGTLASANKFSDELGKGVPDMPPVPPRPASLKDFTDAVVAGGTLGLAPIAQRQFDQGNTGRGIALTGASLLPAAILGAPALAVEAGAYGLEGLRKLIAPEEGESRLGGAIETGLSALPYGRQISEKVSPFLRKFLNVTDPAGGRSIGSLLRSTEKPYRIPSEIPSPTLTKSADDILERAAGNGDDLAEAMAGRREAQDAGFSPQMVDRLNGRPEVTTPNLSYEIPQPAEPTISRLSERPAGFQSTAQRARAAQEEADAVRSNIQWGMTYLPQLNSVGGLRAAAQETLPAVTRAATGEVSELVGIPSLRESLERALNEATTPEARRTYQNMLDRETGRAKFNPITGETVPIEEFNESRLNLDAARARNGAESARSVPRETSIADDAIRLGRDSTVPDVPDAPQSIDIMQQLQDSLAAQSPDPPNLIRSNGDGSDFEDLLEHVQPYAMGTLRGRGDRKYGQAAAEALARLQQEYPSLNATDPMDFLNLPVPSQDPFPRMNRAADQPSLAMLAEFIRNGMK